VETSIRAVAAAFVFFLGTAANAGIVKYTFQAKVISIAEAENPTAAFVNVMQSDFAGTSVAFGDIFSGSFQYDTSVGLGSYQPVQQPGVVSRMYDSGPADVITYVDKATGLTFSSLPSLNWLGSSQVQDSLPVPGAFATDYFGMTHGAMDSSFFASATIFMSDISGNAFQSAVMPAELSLAAFQSARLTGSFLRLSDNGFMMFSAGLTSLERAEVPEPASAFLFALAASGLVGARRMRRSAQR
jgi:hypothetical protein